MPLPALGLEMSKKSSERGWNLEKVATGSETLSIAISAPSSNTRLAIIYNKMFVSELYSAVSTFNHGFDTLHAS